jgi:hypothetical protein
MLEHLNLLWFSMLNADAGLHAGASTSAYSPPNT